MGSTLAGLCLQALLGWGNSRARPPWHARPANTPELRGRHAELGEALGKKPPPMIGGELLADLKAADAKLQGEMSSLEGAFLRHEVVVRGLLQYCSWYRQRYYQS